jgi:hypothetical protein
LLVGPIQNRDRLRRNFRLPGSKLIDNKPVREAYLGDLRRRPPQAVMIDGTGRGLPASQQTTEESPTEGFSVGLMECTPAADLPLRKGVVCPIPYIYGAII